MKYLWYLKILKYDSGFKLRRGNIESLSFNGENEILVLKED